MGAVTVSTLPQGSLLANYARAGHYADCYRTAVPGTVTLEQFVLAFYTTPLFRLERWILAWTVSKPSDDAQVRRLAAGEDRKFAAWTVERRTGTELLMCDFQRRTRSWFRVEVSDDGGPVTALFFGSAVVSRKAGKGKKSLGAAFALLLGFHKLYSRMLLKAARTRLLASNGGG